MPPSKDFACTRCSGRLAAESAVSIVIEVLIGDRVVERLQLFDFHPSCAKFAVGPEMRKRQIKYQEREATIRYSVEPAPH